MPARTGEGGKIVNYDLLPSAGVYNAKRMISDAHKVSALGRKHAARDVLAAIAGLANERGCVTTAMGRLADIAGCSLSSVRRALVILEDHRLLLVIGRKKRVNPLQYAMLTYQLAGDALQAFFAAENSHASNRVHFEHETPYELVSLKDGKEKSIPSLKREEIPAEVRLGLTRLGLVEPTADDEQFHTQLWQQYGEKYTLWTCEVERQESRNPGKIQNIRGYICKALTGGWELPSEKARSAVIETYEPPREDKLAYLRNAQRDMTGKKWLPMTPQQRASFCHFAPKLSKDHQLALLAESIEEGAFAWGYVLGKFKLALRVKSQAAGHAPGDYSAIWTEAQQEAANIKAGYSPEEKAALEAANTETLATTRARKADASPPPSSPETNRKIGHFKRIFEGTDIGAALGNTKIDVEGNTWIYRPYNPVAAGMLAQPHVRATIEKQLRALDPSVKIEFPKAGEAC